MGIALIFLKGFIHKRIQKQSFNFSIDSPQLIIPQDFDLEESIVMCLGEVVC